MAIELNPVGLDPKAKRAYSWIGDPACDVAKSAVGEWRDNGSGLVAHDGQEITVLVCEALGPTTKDVVYGAAEGQFANIAAVHRLAVAYAVTEIQHGPAIRRVHGPGGLRLHDDLLAMLDRQKVTLKTGEEEIQVSLFAHLGTLILADSEPSESQKKVLELPCTPGK